MHVCTSVGRRRLDDDDDEDDDLDDEARDWRGRRSSERASASLGASFGVRPLARDSIVRAATRSFDRDERDARRERDDGTENGELGIGAFIHSLTRRFIDSIRLDRDGAENEGEDDDE